MTKNNVIVILPRPECFLERVFFMTYSVLSCTKLKDTKKSL